MDRKFASGEPLLDARMQRTRVALCRALLALLEEKPFDQVTVREITRKAAIGYATFFRHYPDKGALLNDLASDQIGELTAKTLPILFAIDTPGACREACAYVDQRRKLWRALLTGGAAGVMRDAFIRQAKAIASQHPPVETWIPAELQVVYAIGGTIDILAWWLQQPEPFAPDQVAGILDRLVIAPTMAQA